MYHTPGITTGLGTGAVGAGALAVTGATTFAYVVVAVTLVVGGLLLQRTARMRRAATTQD
jgi:sulfite exporter TauE/SafE